ncbi:MAG: glycosyltransferase family 4 protein [Patescibacteria group bacterium]
MLVLAGTRDVITTPLEENPLPNLKIIRAPELYLIDQGTTHIWQVAKVINDTIATFNPHVVHTHHTYESFAAFLSKQVLNFKLVITIQKSPVRCFHEWKEDPQWLLIRYLYEQGKYDGVIVNSQAYLKMAKFFGAKEPVKLIYYGINKERFFVNKELAQKVRKELGVKDGQILLTVPSRIDERKGIDILIDAISLLKQEQPKIYKDTKVVVAGANLYSKCSDYEKLLLRQIEDLGIKEAIKLGYKNGAYSAINGLYNAADIIVLPSLREGLGFAAIEGMSIKKPIIASNTVGLDEIITNKENGLTFETGNAKSLAKQIVWAIKNPDKLNQIANQGFKWQQGKFLIPDMAKKHLEFYETLV